MQRRGLSLGFLVVLVVLAALGCKPARSSFLPREVALYVAITPEVEKSDTGNVAAMVDRLEAELREAGYNVTILGARADEVPPVPRIEIQVMSSDSGNAQARGAGKLMNSVVGATIAIASGGSMQVDTYWIPGGNGQPRYLARYKGSSFGSISEEEIAAGDNVGHAIARDLLK